MIIDRKILSIPPHISTSWNQISSIHLDESQEGLLLVIILKNEIKITIPHLDRPTIDKIFQHHAYFLESEGTEPSIKDMGLFSLSGPLKFGIEQMETLGSAMQHNPNQSNAPSLPPEILAKIANIVRVLGIEDSTHLPKPEPSCNCVHCQIAKALQISSGVIEENLDDEVQDEDLRFKDWEIEQTDDKLYTVTNPIDSQESYRVYLGKPIGCTCGEKNCVHIKAVLSS